MLRKPHIVVFSTLFPSKGQQQAGIFIRERMFRVAKVLPLTVVSPQPWFPFQSLLRLWKRGYRPSLPTREEQQGITVLRPRFLCIPGFFKRWDGLFLAIGCFYTLSRLRRAGRLDVLDAHFLYPEGYAGVLLGRWLRIPLTVTLRGTEVRQASDRTLRSKLAVALRGADRVFAVSESLKRLATSLVGTELKVRVVGNGIDTKKFSPIPRDVARARLGLPNDASVLISVGGLVERKGFHRVIECMPALVQRFPKLHYLIVGGPSTEGDMSDQLKAQVKLLGLEASVHFLGPLAHEDLSLALSAADLFVLATRNEGWANVLLEAMACGLPVIATDVGGNAEVIRTADVGMLVPFGNEHALRESIARGLTTEWNPARIVAYANQNTWDDRIASLVAQFEQLVEPAALELNSIATRNIGSP